MTKKERFEHVIDYFKLNNPNAETELHYHNPFELLCAVILSAQCTDKRVNMVTPELFEAFPDAWKMSQTTEDELYEYVKSISYPRNKARHLLGMARQLTTLYNGEVPEDYDAMLALPGVGRKTANVMASVIWNKPKMAVDTHVFRVSNRIGLTINSKNVLQTEKELTAAFPPELIPLAHHWLILHGRYVCTAKSPKCEACGIALFCREFQQKNEKKR